jgi:energy-coupling factor transporter ATP-binding protein EcfA2
MPNNQQHIIEVDSLTFAYPSAPDVHVLEGINLTVHEGDFIGIIGPTGAGKTTLCMALRGLIPHAQPGEMSGNVKIMGKSTLNLQPIDLAQSIGFVFQDPESQIIGMTIEEDVAFALQNFGIPADEIFQRIKDALDVVELSGLEHRDTIALSGGQRQRLAIASALAIHPQVLILDEPTSELDPEGKASVFRVLRNLRQSGNVTVVIVEHELEELASSCTHIIVMDEGKILQIGETRDVFRNVSLIRQVMGGRVPQVCEVFDRLIGKKRLEERQFACEEDKAVEILRQLLKMKECQ